MTGEERRGWPGRLAWVVLCCGLILYGSLYPLTGWHRPDAPVGKLLLAPLAGHLSRGDLLVNVLGYLPLGYAAARLWPRRPMAGTVTAVVFGMMLSLAVEILQTMLPGRTPSIADLAANSVGSLLGGAAAFLPLPKMGTERSRGMVQRGGAVVFAAWALWQLAPFVPSLDVSKVREGLKPIWYAIKDPTRFSPAETVISACYVAALGVAFCAGSRRRYRSLAIFLFAGAVVFALKTLIVDRFVLPEELIGFGVGTVAAALLLAVRGNLAPAAALMLAGGAFIFTEIRADGAVGMASGSFNWYPLRYHIPMGFAGLTGILEQLFPGVLMGWAATAVSLERRLDIAVAGGVCGTVGVLALEWYQAVLPGRTPDITQVILFAAGWTAACVANSRFYSHTKGQI